MIIVQAIIPVRSETRDQAIELARKLVDATRAEPGCITYEFYIGLSDPNALMLFQEWVSMDALTEHMRTEHVEHFVLALPELVEGEITMRRYAVQSVDEELDQAQRPPPRIVH